MQKIIILLIFASPLGAMLRPPQMLRRAYSRATHPTILNSMKRAKDDAEHNYENARQKSNAWRLVVLQCEKNGCSGRCLEKATLSCEGEYDRLKRIEKDLHQKWIDFATMARKLEE